MIKHLKAYGNHFYEYGYSVWLGVKNWWNAQVDDWL